MLQTLKIFALYVFAVTGMLGFTGSAEAQTRVSVGFEYGIFGEADNNSHQPTRGVLLSTLGISQVVISQLSNNGQFGGGGTQGNDYDVDVTLLFNDGTTTTFNAAVNWRDTSGSTVRGIGLIRPLGSVADGSGYTPQSGYSTSFLLRFVNQTVTYSETVAGVKIPEVSGNAATNNLLEALNAYVTASPPSTTPSALTTTLTANPTSIAADGTATSTITVQLKDVNGNNLSASGGTVVLSTDAGTLGTVTDNTNGTYTATLTSATTTGTATITGTLDGTGITDDATVEMTDGTLPVITGPDGLGGTTTGTTGAITVDENQTAVTTVTADESVTWTISGSDDDAKFAIDASGVITFVSAPDYETPTDGDTSNDYVLTVTATDTAGNTSTQTITVTVANLDENAPVITGPDGLGGTTTGTTGAITVDENQTAVTTVTADESVTWTISGSDDDAKFAIDASGVITFVSAPDYETPTDGDTSNDYVLTVTATAAGNTSTQTITVTVANLDENAPVITGPDGLGGTTTGTTGAITVDENQTAVTTVTADESVTWTISGSDDDAKFAIDASGVITFVSAPDYETPTDGDTSNDYVLTVTATAAGNTSTQTITVTVANLDENAPVITGPDGLGGTTTGTTGAITVDENQTAVTTVTADESVTWTISGSDDDAKFAIDASGVITFVSAPDYETPTDGDTSNDYVLTVTATAAGNTSTQTITVTVANLDENAPVITGPDGLGGTTTGTTGAITVDENQTAVTTVTADESVTWTISGSDDDAKFAIDASGVITFVSAPDYETPTDGDTSNDYVLTVTATAAGNTSTQTITVTVANLDENAPVITGPDGLGGTTTGTTGAITVDENQTAVTTVTADESVTWTISGSDDDAKFAIDASGVITFVSAPDYETPTDGDTSNDYVLTVTATDTAGNTSTQTITVTVANLDENAPVITGPDGLGGTTTGTTGAITVDENQTAVTTVTADESVTWTISGSDDDAKFAIDASGVITFVSAPDYETPTDGDTSNDYVLTVTATDTAGNTSTQTITVTVANLDENAPVITGPDGLGGTTTGTTGAITVDENQTAVTTVTADESVTWTISSSDDDAKFAIDASGVITFVSAPDYETPTDGDTSNDYVLTVTATAAGNTSTQTITVTILDIWDSLPGTVLNNVTDIDSDGITESLESMTADRDGDGIADSQDYDPQGYLYCEDDGRILTGGSISIARLGGATSTAQTSTYDANGVWIIKDGSDGEYNWFVNAPGTYTMNVSYPSTLGVPSTIRTTSGTLDLTSLLPSNPASIGSSEFGMTGVLANYRTGYALSTPAANTTTAFYTTFVIEAGDPHVIGNNIPVAQCGVNELAVVKTTDGSEANGATPSQGVFTVSQGRISTKPTTVTYAVSGTAASGTDFTALSGSVTIPVGETSATVPVSILEDSLIEGDETIVFTLTSVTSGDLTTQFSATAGQLTASVTITDDDFATVLVSNDDLLATEGRTDDATMRFSLAGQPNSPVTLTFAGDAQCTVSPSTLTFTDSDFATPQALSISAINDEDAEGTHSCNPTVTVTSTDTSFDNFALTLATVTIADDLVDQVRNPLTEVLQNDFEQTVATQSRQFSQISKGALARLQDDEDLRCGVLEPFDVDGTAEAGINSINTSGTFGEEIYDCAIGVRQIINGSFNFIKSDTIDSQGMFTLSVQNEQKVSEEALRGRFFGGYLSNSYLDDIVTGNVRGFGAHAGLYGAYALKDGLFFDYYAAGGVGQHTYSLSFDTATAPISAEGRYRYGALYAGAALSGETVHESVTLRPRLGIDLSYANASDASVSASQLGLTDMGRIKLDAINGTRFFAETIWTFGDTGDIEDGSDKLNRQSSFEVAPRVYCEKGLGQDARDCGYGGYISLSEHDMSNGTDFAIKLDYETNNDQAERISFEFSYIKNIFDGAGEIATKVGGDLRGNTALTQSVSLTF